MSTGAFSLTDIDKPATPKGQFTSEDIQGTAGPATSIGPRVSSGWRDDVANWAEDVRNDIKLGTDTTAIGRVMKALGAKGTHYGVAPEAGDYLASPVLGPFRVLKGGAEITQQPWQGTKDIVGGTLETTQIPASFAAGPAAGKGGNLAASALSKAETAEDAWRKINSVLGVTAKGVRIGKQASELGQAATLPGRALSDLGFTAEQLQKMTPIERMQAISPHWQDAGRAIDEAVQASTHSGKTLDLGATAFEVLKSIADPQLQDRALAQFANLVKELDIANQRIATPAEALRLRRALQAGARFGSSGDLNSLGSIRSRLYGAVSGDLKGAVKGLDMLDQHYSDLKGAMDAAQRGVSKFATKPPEPSLTEKAVEFGKKTVLPWAIKGAIGGGAGYGGYHGAKLLKDLFGSGAE